MRRLIAALTITVISGCASFTEYDTPEGLSRLQEMEYKVNMTQAGKGEIQAHKRLADIHRFKLNDLEGHIKWLAYPAEQGDTGSQVRLGAAHLMGLTGQADFQKAHYWFEKAATAGDDKGQYYLGKLYYHGLTGQHDPVTARYWFDLSAHQGFGRAEQALQTIDACSKTECENPSMLWWLEPSIKDVATIN